MDVIVERCAGLDVHQASVVACVLIGQPGRKPCKEVRSFGTMTRDLEALRDWLKELGVSHVGMESTGVYWKPVHALLEDHFTPDSPFGSGRHARRPWKRWRNCGFLLSPFASVMTRLPNPA